MEVKLHRLALIDCLISIPINFNTLAKIKIYLMVLKSSKFLFISILFFLVSCSKDTDPMPTEPLEATQFLDETYGSEVNQDYDIYLPENRTAETPVIIIVHGGFWSQGDKDDMNLLVAVARNKSAEFAIVNTNYRLATLTSNQHPAQVNDIQMLITELESKKEEYQISNNYYFIGASAGAHLALLHAYKNDTNHHVKAVCSIVGPTDFTDPAYVDSGNVQFQLFGEVFLGDTFENNPSLYEDASPITHVDAQDAPTIMFYGGKDELIPVSQATRLEDKLTEAGIPVEYTLFPEEAHDLKNADFNEISTKIAAFFEKYR